MVCWRGRQFLSNVCLQMKEKSEQQILLNVGSCAYLAEVATSHFPIVESKLSERETCFFLAGLYEARDSCLLKVH